MAIGLTLLSHFVSIWSMSVEQERRIYVTFNSEKQADDIRASAKAVKKSASKYILSQLELLNKIKSDKVGIALIATLNGKNNDQSILPRQRSDV